MRVRVERAHVGERDTAGRWATAGGRHHMRSHLTKLTAATTKRDGRTIRKSKKNSKLYLILITR